MSGKLGSGKLGSGNFSLVLSLARREIRGGIKSFRVFLACLALGVAAIAGVGSISDSVVAGLDRDARRLLGGDIELRLISRPATPDHRQFFEQSGRSSEVIEMRAMAQPAINGSASRSRSLVELKAVDKAYPLVDQVDLKESIALTDALARNDGVWGAIADASLFAKLSAKVGDLVKVGDAQFRLMATITREPDRVTSVISFGPRIMIAAAALAETKLVQPGSQIRYRYRVVLKEGTDPSGWVEGVNEIFPAAGWRVRGRGEAAPGLQRFIDRMTLFLTFVGLTTLLVGGIGVTNAVKSYLDGKTTTIATLKCLGGSGRNIFATYFVLILLLAIVGIIIGLVVGATVPLLAASASKDLLPIALAVKIFPEPLILAAAFGILTAITFALWPLARARDIPAANLFRSEVAPSGGLPSLPYLIAVILGALALAGLTVITSPDKGFALWFVGGSIVALLVLRISAAGVTALSRRIGGFGSTDIRLAFANLHRPGSVTSSVIVSLGLGLTVLVAIALIQGNIARQVDERLPDAAPSFFFLDIQPSQVAAFDKTVAGIEGIGALQRVPTIRGRIVKIAGTPVDQVQIHPNSAWAVRGDRALTFADRPFENAIIVAGEWWPPDYTGPPLISLDANLARGFGINVGDNLTLNILGREFTAKIANLRTIDWRSMRFDFAIIFAPGSLEGAPHIYNAALQAPQAIEEAVEQAVSDQFSNISIIRVREALEAASKILEGIGTAVRATAAVTIFAGALVLSGAVAAGRRRRTYDAIIFKVLGATRGKVLKTFLMEYGLLGVVTGIVSAIIGTVTAWAIVVGLMDMAWVFLPETVAITVVLSVLLTLMVGFAGTWRAMGQKASPYLRNE